MSEITAEHVAHVAHLARIDLSSDEKRAFARELTVIVEAIASISEAVGPEVPATSHPLPLSAGLREDVVSEVLERESVLADAPGRRDGCFMVPAILQED